MGAIKLDKAREAVPVVLNLVKDTGWCYTWGIVSVITIIPVLSFQVYEIWRARKEGTHKVMQNVVATLAVAANGTWMIGDLYFQDHFQPYVKWIFNLGFLCLGLYAIFVYRQIKKDKSNEQASRMMMVSKQTRGLVFVHSRMSYAQRRPYVESPHGAHVMITRHRARRSISNTPGAN